MRKIMNAATSVSLLALIVYTIRSLIEKHREKRYTTIPCHEAGVSER